MRRLAAAPADRAAAAALGSTPVAVTPETLAQEIRAVTRIVELSGDTAGKQRARHPDLRPDDYRVIQQALDGGRLQRQGDTHLRADIEIDGIWWRAVIKRTQDGGELFLVSLHRLRPRQITGL
jgi:hypothetical protein